MSDMMLCSEGLTFATNAGALALRAAATVLFAEQLGATEVSRSLRRRLTWATILGSQCTSLTDTLQSTFEESTDAGIKSPTRLLLPACTRKDVHSAPRTFQKSV